MAIIDQWAADSHLPDETLAAIHRVDGHIRQLASDFEAFNSFGSRAEPEIIHRFDRVRNVLQWADRPGVFGVFGMFGIALSADQDSKELAAELLVDSTLAATQGIPWSSFRETQADYVQRLQISGPLDALSDVIDVRVSGISPPVPHHCSPGVAISAALPTPRNGKFGCRVTTAAGLPAVTTAGHVVCGVALYSVVGGTVCLRCEQGPCGQPVTGSGCHRQNCPVHGQVCQAPTVCFSGTSYPVTTFFSPMCQPGSNPPAADIAVLELPEKHVEGLPITLLNVGTVSARDPITVAGHTSWARRALAALYLGLNHAAWDDVVDTAAAISAQGDSGAPAERQPGEIIGHVVGGTVGANTYIQDLGCQLKAIGVTFRK